MIRGSSRLVAVLAACAFAAGCASTQATSQRQYSGYMPKPRLILVYRFAASPGEIDLDRSPTAVAQWKLSGIAPSQERIDVGDKVAAVLADHLVQKLQAEGLPAQIGEGPPDLQQGPVLVVDGQFLSINEGSRAERLVIGLGAGASNVRTEVQLVEMGPDGRRLLDQFEVDAKSGRKPGMAETMGAGGAAGHLAASAAVSVAGAVASEEFGDNVEADAERTAAKVKSMLDTYFEEQGWIPPQGGGM
jgi:hypothetical protein